MASTGQQRSLPLVLLAVFLLLVSCAPLLSTGFLLPTFSTQQQQRQQQQRQQHSSFVRRATSPLLSGASRAASSTAATVTTKPPAVRRHAGQINDADVSNNGAASATAASLRRQQQVLPRRRQQSPHVMAGSSIPRCFRNTRSTSTSTSTRRLVVMEAGSKGRVGGDSSRRRTDRPDQHDPGERKKKTRGGGKSGGRGQRARGGRGEEGSVPKAAQQQEEHRGVEDRRSSLGQKVVAEFSRNIDCSVLSRKAKYYTVEATEKECALLATRFSLEGITGLKAELRVSRAPGRDFRKINVKGRVESDVCQLCASTTEPFDVNIVREFETTVQEVSLDSVESTLWALEKDTETDDEIMEGDPLDLGEIAAQALALSIDPFARHPDAKRDDGGESPFYNNFGGFGAPKEGEDVVLDVATMKAFFDGDD